MLNIAMVFVNLTRSIWGKAVWPAQKEASVDFDCFTFLDELCQFWTNVNEHRACNSN